MPHNRLCSLSSVGVFSQRSDRVVTIEKRMWNGNWKDHKEDVVMGITMVEKRLWNGNYNDQKEDVVMGIITIRKRMWDGNWK